MAAEGVRDDCRWLARLVRFVDVDDQVEACRRVFASDTRWTVVRGSDLEEGESEGLPVEPARRRPTRQITHPRRDGASTASPRRHMTIERML